ncbi:MAG: preprotein translocase subunit YajC, partial [Pseudomonadota bacterium]|nr:preprotein translocase subunit YajC [Pseudomonadota bacterium]
AGDLHHYARYEPTAATRADTPHRFTCGGGGAYLLGTHDLPKDLSFKSGQGRQQYRQRTRFPDVETSKGLRNKAWRLPTRNFVFCSLLAAVYLLYAWVLQSASKVPSVGLHRVTLMEYLSDYPITFGNAFVVLPVAVFNATAHSPSSVLLTLGVVVGAAVFTASSAEENKRRAWLGGAIHGMLHLGLALMLLWAAALFNLGTVAPALGRDAASFVDHPLQVLLFTVEASVLGGVLGGLLFGSWMMITNAWLGWHHDEVFSSQGIADYKCFLRLRLDASGLTIYPLKIAKACSKWKAGVGVTVLTQLGRTWRLRVTPGSGPRFEPVEPIAIELIEQPIHIPVTSPHPQSTP